MTASSTVRFSGVIPPVVTPLFADDQLDGPAVDRIVDHIIGGGAAGLFVLGTTGEGPSLNYQIRYEMVERTCEATRGRVPVLVGVTDTSLSESLSLAEHAASCGAAATVAAVPFYFDVPQSALVDWFRRLADESPLPLMLYNMPSCVGVVLDLAAVEELSHHPNIIGIKDSGGDKEYFAQLVQDYAGREDFVVFIGPEERLAEAVAQGAAGGVCGGANLLPQVYSDLYHASKNAETARVSELLAIVDRMFDGLYRNDTGRIVPIPGLKYAMSLCGLCSPLVAPPLTAISPEHAARVSRTLRSLPIPAGLISASR